MLNFMTMLLLTYIIGRYGGVPTKNWRELPTHVSNFATFKLDLSRNLLKCCDWLVNVTGSS